MNFQLLSIPGHGAAAALIAAALTTLPLSAGHASDTAQRVIAAAESLPQGLPQSVSVNSRGQKAYGHALPMIGADDFARMVEGKRVFSRTWLPPGTGPAGHQGLGPLFNAPSCIDCHFRDGRGGLGQTPPPLIFRILEQANQYIDKQGNGPYVQRLPGRWGRQLQPYAVAAEPEGRVDTTYEQVQGHYADGTPYTLRRPVYTVEGFGPAAARQLGPRIPPTLVGVGLLDAADEQAILDWADPDDADGDGISGRPNFVGTGENRRLGRFGWKSGQPGLAEQVAGALAEDMGIVAPVLAGAHQAPEISRVDFARLLDYLRLLAPPAPRTQDPLFVSGKAVFDALQCGGCHRPRLATGNELELPGSTGLPESGSPLEFEPYTDLLLHDLGAALADGDGGRQIEREWRTAPLWGLGLMEAVNGQLLLLHDGRARSFEEAILWHGGEAQASRARFLRLSKAKRDALAAFLRSI